MLFVRPRNVYCFRGQGEHHNATSEFPTELRQMPNFRDSIGPLSKELSSYLQLTFECPVISPDGSWTNSSSADSTVKDNVGNTTQEDIDSEASSLSSNDVLAGVIRSIASSSTGPEAVNQQECPESFGEPRNLDALESAVLSSTNEASNDAATKSKSAVLVPALKEEDSPEVPKAWRAHTQWRDVSPREYGLGDAPEFAAESPLSDATSPDVMPDEEFLLESAPPNKVSSERTCATTTLYCADGAKNAAGDSAEGSVNPTEWEGHEAPTEASLDTENREKWMKAAEELKDAIKKYANTLPPGFNYGKFEEACYLSHSALRHCTPDTQRKWP